ncbi:IS1/IS1595 family N-terminal zinc-binding domain-containing protein, partial [Bifidobacterium longum]
MRTPSSKAKRCPVCGRAMKKNGRTGKGVQRWKCPA